MEGGEPGGASISRPDHGRGGNELAGNGEGGGLFRVYAAEEEGEGGLEAKPAMQEL